MKKTNLIQYYRYIGDWENSEEEGKLYNLNDIYDMQLIGNIEKYLESIKDEKYYLSVDLAGGGKDSTVFLLMKGLNTIYSIEQIEGTGNDGKLILEKINRYKEKYGITDERIVVDTLGVGDLFADFLGEAVFQYKSSNSPLVPTNQELNDNFITNYINLRAQSYMTFCSLIQEGKIKILEKDEKIKEKLFQELDCMKQINVGKKDKIQVIAKDDIKKAIGRSPDIADALAMVSVFITNPPHEFFYFT